MSVLARAQESEMLVKAACCAIVMIWTPRGTGAYSDSEIVDLGCREALSLRRFVKELLRLSRTTVSTIKIALWYLHKTKISIRAKLQLARNAQTVLSNPTTALEYSVSDKGALQQAISDPLTCGRRTFVAALQLAHKFLQDHTYSAFAWARISYQSVAHVNSHEKALLELLDYNVFINVQDFRCWSYRLRNLVNDQERRALDFKIHNLPFDLSSDNSGRRSLR